MSFFGLAAYVTVDAVLSLTGLREPDHSPVGIVLAAVSLAIMPFLSLVERRTGTDHATADDQDVQHLRLELEEGGGAGLRTEGGAGHVSGSRRPGTCRSA